ncbi:MAG: ABC transporter ATP-binding protein [Omnitrophica WOR_2 bacterium]
MLDFSAVDVTYGPHLILQDVTFSIEKGEVVSLIGPNGAGKTTLIRAASGVIPICSGSISFAGQNLQTMNASRRARSVAVVPQARNLPETFTAFETVLMGRTPYLGWLGQTGPRDDERARWALERTGIPGLAGRLVGELSGGEQQLVLLARALAQETSILLLDEPTSHLDLRHQAHLLNLVHDLARQQGLAVLMALHDLNLASIYSDRVALLVDGRLRALGLPDEVLTLENLEAAYQVPLNVTRHPDYGTPLILPDGIKS